MLILPFIDYSVPALSCIPIFISFAVITHFVVVGYIDHRFKNCVKYDV